MHNTLGGGRAIAIWSAFRFGLIFVALDAVMPFQPTLADEAATPAFRDGRADRQAWETWFNGLSGTYQAGAEFWASHRSDPSPPDCTSMNDAAFRSGCEEAKKRLNNSDRRRRTEADYKAGWNSPLNEGIGAPASNGAAEATDAAHLRQGWLGINIDTVASSGGAGQPGGAVVGSVVPDGAAAKAGIHAGDIVVSFNGKVLSDWQNLPLLVAAKVPGTMVEVGVRRGGPTVVLKVELGERPPSATAENIGARPAQCNASDVPDGDTVKSSLISQWSADLDADNNERVHDAEAGARNPPCSNPSTLGGPNYVGPLFVPVRQWQRIEQRQQQDSLRLSFARKKSAAEVASFMRMASSSTLRIRTLTIMKGMSLFILI